MGYEVVDWIQFFQNNVVKDFVISFYFQLNIKFVKK